MHSVRRWGRSGWPGHDGEFRAAMAGGAELAGVGVLLQEVRRVRGELPRTELGIYRHSRAWVGTGAGWS